MGPRRGLHRAGAEGGKRVLVLRCASKGFRHREGQVARSGVSMTRSHSRMRTTRTSGVTISIQRICEQPWTMTADGPSDLAPQQRSSDGHHTLLRGRLAFGWSVAAVAPTGSAVHALLLL